jgi:hypothetical protein
MDHPRQRADTESLMQRSPQIEPVIAHGQNSSRLDSGEPHAITVHHFGRSNRATVIAPAARRGIHTTPCDHPTEPHYNDPADQIPGD